MKYLADLMRKYLMRKLLPYLAPLAITVVIIFFSPSHIVERECYDSRGGEIVGLTCLRDVKDFPLGIPNDVFPIITALSILFVIIGLIKILYLCIEEDDENDS